MSHTQVDGKENTPGAPLEWQVPPRPPHLRRGTHRGRWSHRFEPILWLIVVVAHPPSMSNGMHVGQQQGCSNSRWQIKSPTQIGHSKREVLHLWNPCAHSRAIGRQLQPQFFWMFNSFGEPPPKQTPLKWPKATAKGHFFSCRTWLSSWFFLDTPLTDLRGGGPAARCQVQFNRERFLKDPQSSNGIFFKKGAKGKGGRCFNSFHK